MKNLFYRISGIFWRSLAVGIGYTLVLLIAGRIAPMSGAVDAHGGESIIWIPFLSGILIGLTLSAVASQMTASRLRHFFIWSCVVFFNLLSVILEGVFFAPDLVSGAIPSLIFQQLLASLVMAALISILKAEIGIEGEEKQEEEGDYIEQTAFINFWILKKEVINY